MAFGRKHDLLVGGERIRTPRLLLRPWALDDAEAALAVFGASRFGQYSASRRAASSALSPRRSLDRWAKTSLPVEAYSR